jgi:hypothetical protein
MRLVAAFLLAAAFMTGTVHAQPSGTSSTYAPTALHPENCGTPDAPKACPGAKGMPKHHTTYKGTPKH